MAKKRMVMELGMGSSLRQQDYTRAACRAVEDALWHNSLSIADAFGLDRSAMIIEVEIGVQQPENCLLYTSPSPRDGLLSRMPSSA